MYLCYVDESGTSAIPGNTSHFVLAGLTIPIRKWNECERKIQTIKAKFQLSTAEIHTGWILRIYNEQNKVPDFETLSYSQRRTEVEKLRKIEILRHQRATNKGALKQLKKNYRQTEAYIHLTLSQRKDFVFEVAKQIGSWGFTRLFAECIDKVYFDPRRTPITIDAQAFEQLVSRLERYLSCEKKEPGKKDYGLLVHDNNDTIAKKHTELMKKFHQHGTFWTSVNHIIETPLFVNSELTSMIQLADVCAYSIRRYLENGEEELFNEIFKRADRKSGRAVGIRHFTDSSCSCKICQAHSNSSPCIPPR
jgi:hypothetical protein